jgi:ABC-type lipoprotein release transport system permease subunit
MYISFIGGQIWLLLGLYYFINRTDKSISHSLILMGLISTGVAMLLFFLTQRKGIAKINKL